MKRISVILMLCGAAMLSARELQLPVLPGDIVEPQERARYLLEHYWDNLDWRDTTLTLDDRFMEQAAADYYSVFNLVDSVTASAAVGTMLDAASADSRAYKKIADISRIYLFDPESPVADDEVFLVVADRLLADGKLPESDLLRIADARRMAMLNRVGSTATDFVYVDRDGNTATLHDALSRHSRNLLIFYDPDCHVCAELEEHLMSNLPGDTGVVMISPYGEQDGLWAQHAATMPADWIVGRPVSEDFEDEEIYDLRTIPTVLVLDGDAKVLSKKLKSR